MDAECEKGRQEIGRMVCQGDFPSRQLYIASKYNGRRVVLRQRTIHGSENPQPQHNSLVLPNSHSQAGVPRSSILSVIVGVEGGASSRREQTPILYSKFVVMMAVCLGAWRINRYSEGDGTWGEFRENLPLLS